MLELGAGAAILRALAYLYIALIVTLIGAFLWYPKRRWIKITGASLVLLVFTGPAYLRGQEREKVVEERKARYQEAKALFDEQCKTAGEKVYRTVDDVEGIFVLRPRAEAMNYAQQFKLDDPYGYAGTGLAYLRLFVRGRSVIPTEIGQPLDPMSIVTYRFVEVTDEASNQIHRFTTSMPKEESERIARNGGGSIPLDKEVVLTRAAGYGITWDDISTAEDRAHWIAGSSEKIIDLDKNEVIAERVGYMFDAGLGSTAGGRSPWSSARRNACPPLDNRVFYFFDRVLKPRESNR